MARKIISIALLYLRITFSQRSVFIFSIAMPLLFTFVLAQAIFGPGEQPTSWALALVDEDGGRYSQALVDRLHDDPLIDVQAMELEAARSAVESEEAPAGLVIPAGFSRALADGQEARLSFLQSSGEIARAQILEQAVTAAYDQLSGSLQAAELAVRLGERMGLFDHQAAPTPGEIFDTAFAAAEAAWEKGAPVGLQAEAVTRLENSSDQGAFGASQSSPGMLVMYALFFTFGGGISLIVERDEGTLRRLLVMPISKGVIMSGKLLGIFLGAVVQMSIMVLAGQFLFAVNWGQSPPALVLMLLSYGFAGTTLGLLVAAIARTAAQANTLGTIVVLAFASLGGAWWPIEIVPAWMRQAAQVLPTYWAMQGFHDIISRGLDVPAVVLEAAVLLGFGLLFLAVGIWRFRYE